MRHPLTLVLSSVILSVASMAAGQQKEKRHQYQYLIPKGYVGWIRVDFNVKDAPALPIEGDSYVVKIPATCHFQTSTEDAYGLVGDVYHYECGGRRQRLIITANICRVN